MMNTVKHASCVAALALLGVSAAALAEPIDIPSGVFVALEYPSDGAGIGNSKHVTWAYNPLDKRLYSIGGDFPAGDAKPDSYRQDHYSLSIAERWANRDDRDAGWRLEYPYCGPDGGIQPKSPDFVGWTWDSNRNVFWFVPGTSVIPVREVCSDRSGTTDDDPKYKFNHLMTYDPTEPDRTQRWTTYGKDETGYKGEKWQSVYDPETDTITRFSWNQDVDIYDVESGTWTTLNTGTNALGETVRVYDDMLSPDFVERVIYAVDGTKGRLMRWDMDRRRMDDLGEVPDGPVSPEGNGYSVWDSVNRVLIFFHMNTRRLHVYHPDEDRWETPDVTTDPAGLTPFVRHAMVFDPSNNVTAFLGNTDPSVPYMFLYRYAPSGPAPRAPADFRVD